MDDVTQIQSVGEPIRTWISLMKLEVRTEFLHRNEKSSAYRPC